MPKYLGAIDQGTTSTRFIVFDRSGRTLACAQREHRQIYPQPGRVEHDPEEIWHRTQEVIARAMQECGLRPADLAAAGYSGRRWTWHPALSSDERERMYRRWEKAVTRSFDWED